MQRKKSGLGKGLDALIPGGTSAPSREGVLNVPVEQISPNPRQPRTKFDPSELGELAASIQEHGIIQPLIVTYDSSGDRYILIAGERRLQAARTAGLEQVPVILRDDASEQQYLELALIENVQRTDLNPLEAAEAYRQLTADFNLSHEEIAARVGKSRTAITNTLRLLKLPPSIQQYLVDGYISEGHARALLALPNHQAQTALVEIVIDKDLNVRQTEELVRKYSGQKPTTSSRPTPPPEIRSLEDRLRTHLGTRVKLHHGQKGGSITIHYYSDEELNQIISQILGE
jgi:ParB family transcriptional regulator, chromosome partitioning protein